MDGRALSGSKGNIGIYAALLRYTGSMCLSWSYPPKTILQMEDIQTRTLMIGLPNWDITRGWSETTSYSATSSKTECLRKEEKMGIVHKEMKQSKVNKSIKRRVGPELQ
ncbi:hypothetical protein C8R44DRAFT_734184 [Mycena epipterygia]|nr:hypothetical protein C8R44DRAFT_734184 [Mycena epipterygia]